MIQERTPTLDLGNHKNEGSRIDQLTQALEETIQVIKETRRSFKSNELAKLRRKLEKLLENGKPE